MPKAKAVPKKRPASSRSKSKSKPGSRAKKAKLSPRVKRAKPAPRSKATAKRSVEKPASGIDGHPGYALLVQKLAPGRHAGGALLVTEPGAHDEQMGRWLMGKTEGRRSIGRTAFGDIVVFRDLRARAAELGLPGAEVACDVAMVDVHYKRMTMIAESAETLLASLDRADWRKAFLRWDLYEKARQRLGDYSDDECFCFTLPLAMGGGEDAASVQRANWLVHQDILLQT
jgi:hypothetical protein